MAIQLPPNIQLEQDPYVKSRAGFNAYLDFIKEQKDRVSSARQMAQQKKLLAEQKQDKMAELQAEYDFKLRNETQIQHMRGEQSMAETKYTTNAKLESDALAAMKAHFDMLRKANQEGQKAAQETFKNIVSDYRPVLESLGISGAVRVDYKVDDAGMFDTFVSVGDQLWNTQDFYSMLETEKNYVDGVNKFRTSWEENNKTGETRDTREVGGRTHVGNDETGNAIMASLQNPNDPNYEINRRRVVDGTLVPFSQDIQGTEDVAKQGDVFYDMRNVLAGIQANLVYTPGEYTLRAKETTMGIDWLAKDTYIDLNQPVAKIREQITNYVNNYEGRDFAQPFAQFNSQLATYVTQFQRTKNPTNPEKIDPAHIYYNPDNFELTYDPDRSDRLRVGMEQILNGGKTDLNQLYNRFNVPPAK